MANLIEGSRPYWRDNIIIIPGYSKGKHFDLKAKVINTRGDILSVEAAEAFARMERDAGFPILINSAYRTNAHQQYLFDLNAERKRKGQKYVTVAPPGRSYHQSGRAIDVTRGRSRNFVRDNGERFKFYRTVPSESWHFEYRPNR